MVLNVLELAPAEILECNTSTVINDKHDKVSTPHTHRRSGARETAPAAHWYARFDGRMDGVWAAKLGAN